MTFFRLIYAQQDDSATTSSYSVSLAELTLHSLGKWIDEDERWSALLSVLLLGQT